MNISEKLPFFVRKPVQMIMTTFERVWKREFALDPHISPVPRLPTKHLVSAIGKLFLSRTAICLLLGVFLGVSLTIGAAVFMLCNVSYTRRSSTEIKSEGGVLGSKKRKKKLFTENLMSPAPYSARPGETDGPLRMSNTRETHRIESCDWWNTIAGKMFSNYSRSTHFREHVVDLLETFLEKRLKNAKEALNGPSRRKTGHFSFPFEDISVTELAFDDGVPLFTNARVLNASPLATGLADAVVHLDIYYPGRMRLAVECNAVFNWPKPAFATIPVAVSLSLAELYTTCAVQVKDQCVTFSLLEITSCLGYRTQLRNLPKIKTMILTQIQTFLRKQLMAPQFLTVFLPSLRDSLGFGLSTRSPLSKKMKYETKFSEPLDLPVPRKPSSAL
jgi:hypothetical protein